MPELNYELAPRQGMPASQRKAELDSARFVAVRNLAYMVYKKSDGQPLMTYQETLDDREKVKQMILQHELGLGLLMNDLGQVPVAGAPQQMGAAPPNGATPGGYPVQAPVGMPQMAPVMPGYGQPPQQQMVPVTSPQYPTAPAVASPTQAAQAATGAGQVTPSEATPGQPTGKRRRGAAAAQQPSPPPVQSPPQQQMVAGFAQPTAPAQQAFAPAMVPQQTQQPTQVAPVQTNAAAMLDLTPLLQRIDSVGQATNDLEKQLGIALDELRATRAIAIQALAALHHLYATNTQLAPQLGQAQVQTFDQFRSYLGRFTGNPT